MRKHQEEKPGEKCKEQNILCLNVEFKLEMSVIEVKKIMIISSQMMCFRSQKDVEKATRSLTLSSVTLERR